MKDGDLVKMKIPHPRYSKGFGIVIGFKQHKNFDGSNSKWAHIQFPCDSFPGPEPRDGISTMDVGHLEVISESR